MLERTRSFLSDDGHLECHRYHSVPVFMPSVQGCPNPPQTSTASKSARRMQFYVGEFSGYARIFRCRQGSSASLSLSSPRNYRTLHPTRDVKSPVESISARHVMANLNLFYHDDRRCSKQACCTLGLFWSSGQREAPIHSKVKRRRRHNLQPALRFTERWKQVTAR